MPAAVTKSILAQKLGAKAAKAIANHKGDTTTVELSGGALPAGIEDGVAKIVTCEIGVIKPGKQNAGQPYFRAAAVIVSPVEHEGRKIEGRQTSLMIPLYDTPTRKEGARTVDDHIATVLSYMRSWGIDTSSIGEDASVIETELCPQVVAAEIYVGFRTWKGEKQTVGPYAGREPRVNESWGGAVAWEGEGPATTADVQDDTAAPADDVDDNTVAEEVEDTANDNSDELTSDQLAALAKDADNKKSKTHLQSGERLTAIAKERGVDDDAVGDAKNWAAVVELIEAAGDEPAADADEEVVPAKEEVWDYTPVDPKTKKPMINPKTKKVTKIECEVTAVDKKTRTVTLKNLDDQKTVYKGVSWDALSAK